MKEIIVQKITAQFPSSIVSVNEYRGELTIVVKKQDIAKICPMVKEDSDLRFDSMRDFAARIITGPDERFEVIYNLYSLKNNFRLRLESPCRGTGSACTDGHRCLENCKLARA